MNPRITVLAGMAGTLPAGGGAVADIATETVSVGNPGNTGIGDLADSHAQRRREPERWDPLQKGEMG